MTKSEILARLPYDKPFRFVDELQHITEERVEGTFTFNEGLDFYQGHFKDFPVTPGVLLTECCAQIGLVCLGIYLLKDSKNDFPSRIAFSSSEMEFVLPVFPGETVTVYSEKVYFRFGKLKCKVQMVNQKGQQVCKGVLAGMFKTVKDGN
ncbi:3-hydroxyacyl-ACP dehydratase FabZ family protein [Flagellimonas allohymeniacidonis]|uniref:Hydroxymyristoyl-ACP dehydratase n=1 Tax=Flagellimonas allohymeniacidonis TaxID=2517819 RepID=A0A4Q8QHU3_9FLAO|nr:hydroxymyristoyl-ACP dehydratase [Allomuricauda hymeniacidonis]TAI48858.1 hydroxymyristoyl-ACP dehydratase [Allomuricauda hymeniacidonis]